MLNKTANLQQAINRYGKLLFQQYNNKVCMGKLKIWATEEDQILIRVNSNTKRKKWKQASDELRQMGFYRTDIECRERYVNHLDPCVNKNGWSDAELETLYSKYEEYGNRWFLLQKHLPGRTQNKIKNYFYGRIRFFLKIIVKIIHKTSTGFIGDIKTDTLLDIYEAKNKFQPFSIIQKTIRKLEYKIEKKTCVKMIKENLEQFQKFSKFFIANYSRKPTSQSQDSAEEIYFQQQEEETPTEKESVSPTAITLVSMVHGTPSKPQQERNYLRRMADLHWKQYQCYYNAYHALKQTNQHHRSHI